MTLFSKVAGALAFLGLAGVAAAQPRVVLVEDTSVYERKEIGRIPGAVRIAGPEAGGHAPVLTQGDGPRLG